MNNMKNILKNLSPITHKSLIPMQKIYSQLPLFFFFYLIVYNNILTPMYVNTVITNVPQQETFCYNPIFQNNNNFLLELSCQNVRRYSFLSHYNLLSNNPNQSSKIITTKLNNSFVSNQHEKIIQAPKTKKSLNLHENSHSQIIYLCNYPNCGKKYKSKSGLFEHKKLQHTPEEKKRFACNYCTQKFVLPSLLNKHIKWGHRIKKTNDNLAISDTK